MACDGDRAATTPRPADRRQFDLQMTVVHDDDGPDRATMFPPDADECERTTTWLSANRSAFEALDSMR